MAESKDTTALFKKFVSLLETIYGHFNASRNSFESTSNSKIARDLCYSDSQFSRLINNTASEGEFKRAVHNVERLRVERKIEAGAQEKTGATVRSRYPYIIGLAFIVLGLILGFVIENLINKPAQENTESAISRYDMLKWSFENKYIQPYVKLRELPEDCNYPCYKYQGKWKLKKEYKIPFFRERNGFHWVAKDATMYARCMDERNEGGQLFEGYEYQLHEIWYDKREFPIDSFLVANSQNRVRDSYNNANLANDKNFVKVASVHTFFRNEFTIDSSLVYRSGKVIGRDIEFLKDDAYGDLGLTQKFIQEVKDEINLIANNRLEDFSKPIACQPAEVPDVDFNLIEQGDELQFKCQFTTGRFLVDYEKSFVLDDQYINNYCR
ncbi:MAG: hypothetical protein CL868_17760 [Cytophagaceae bacterium]|nr:hypothetical protein [Cytophagaceae bacterium]|tara:strand:+ start:12334 stop:13479 length:1146 start_codon:yes stop_codon:yes gene_type:complete